MPMFLALIVIWALLMVRNEVAYRIRMAANEACYQIKDWSLYHQGPSYEGIMFDPHKWTFAQTYPELAKKIEVAA